MTDPSLRCRFTLLPMNLCRDFKLNRMLTRFILSRSFEFNLVDLKPISLVWN